MPALNSAALSQSFNIRNSEGCLDLLQHIINKQLLGVSREVVTNKGDVVTVTNEDHELIVRAVALAHRITQAENGPSESPSVTILVASTPVNAERQSALVSLGLEADA